MTCILCSGNLKQSTTTYFEELDNCYVIVKNVPCMECEECGEIVYTAEVAVRLDEIIDKIKNLMTEVAIVNYTAA
ncbi:MAG: type II toxin-antitoxin system MqsA family antitoxin [Ruminococcaceae bacterium]|nr:type II toxin-antitoxin system MqsA family antitoxin [Oscillospiraceae bacterium]